MYDPLNISKQICLCAISKIHIKESKISLGHHLFTLRMTLTHGTTTTTNIAIQLEMKYDFFCAGEYIQNSAAFIFCKWRSQQQKTKDKRISTEMINERIFLEIGTTHFYNFVFFGLVGFVDGKQILSLRFNFIFSFQENWTLFFLKKNHKFTIRKYTLKMMIETKIIG